jgi:anti-anti-sigma factor
VISTAEIRNGVCFVTLAGEFDRANVGQLRAEIDSCLQEASSVLFDFGAVSFANGGVLSLLQDILEGLEEGAWLGIARPLPGIEKTFQVAGLIRQPSFRVFATLGEALEVIERG